MKTNNQPSEVISGVIKVGNILLIIFCIGLFLNGVSYTFFTGEHSRILGLIFLAISSTILFVTMDKWVNIVPGIMGYGVLIGIIMTVSGHLLNNRNIPVSRMEGLFTVFFAISGTVLSLTFTNRPLKMIDRVGLMGFVFCIAIGMGYDSDMAGKSITPVPLSHFSMISLGIALCTLLFTWLVNRFLVKSYGVPRRK